MLQDESKTVERVLNFLELDTPFFRISSKCREVAVPLLCLFFFGPVCDSRGVAYRPSFTECLQVSTNASLCANEWQLAQAFDVELPDCHSDKFTNDLPPSIICTVLEAENATDNPSNSSSGKHITPKSILVYSDCIVPLESLPPPAKSLYESIADLYNHSDILIPNSAVLCATSP